MVLTDCRTVDIICAYDRHTNGNTKMSNQVRYNKMVHMLDVVSIIAHDRINTHNTPRAIAMKAVYRRMCDVAGKFESADGVDRYAVK